MIYLEELKRTICVSGSIVKRFSDYTGINSAALIQESAQMKRADYKNELFTELFPESDNTLEIMNLLTNMFCSPTSDKEWKNTVHCMSKEELELFREEIFDKGWIL